MYVCMHACRQVCMPVCTRLWKEWVADSEAVVASLAGGALLFSQQHVLVPGTSHHNFRYRIGYTVSRTPIPNLGHRAMLAGLVYRTRVPNQSSVQGPVGKSSSDPRFCHKKSASVLRHSQRLGTLELVFCSGVFIPIQDICKL